MTTGPCCAATSGQASIEATEREARHDDDRLVDHSACFGRCSRWLEPSGAACRGRSSADEWIRTGREACYEQSREVQMLLAVVVILLVLAVAGGLAVHPLLFLIAILALLAFFGGRRSLV
jgi:hypothetical protein